MWCIIDIETTGVSKHKGKITEIAIYKHDGQRVIDEFVSLVNPETTIPYDITRLTGISNAMVEDAPKFYEIAQQIIEITEDATFVAHNVNFDYGFIQHEFADLGYSFQRKKLCTVKQSRLLLPGHRSYSLGKLCRDLGIIIDGRHRAAGDAFATVKLFEQLYAIDPKLGMGMAKEVQLSSYLHPELDAEKVMNVPKKTGVYYLYNVEKEVIYVGKSTNLHKRIANHLRNPKTQKAIQMHKEVADLSFEITNSELIALLLEAEEIKRLQPKFNRAQKRKSFEYGLTLTTDLFGYQLLQVTKNQSGTLPITTYSTLNEGKKHVEKICEDYQLCRGLTGLQQCNRGCVFFGTQVCKGAALCEVDADTYNQNVQKAIKSINIWHKSVLIIEPGTTKDLHYVIWIEKGHYKGYGLVDFSYDQHPDQLKEAVQHKMETPDVKGILSYFLRTGKAKKVIEIKALNHQSS